MDTHEKFTFRIDCFTPETLPMSRLAEYLAQLAALYGSEEQVHFDKIKRGSAILQAIVDEPAISKVCERLRSVQGGDPEQDAKKAYAALDHLLRVDNAVGTISREKGGKVLEVPGRKVPAPEIYTITQATSVDGVVIKIGGKDNTIPVTLRDQEGKLINCQIRGEAQAKALSQHYLASPIRVHGIGKWIRYPDGTWEIDSLQIQRYETLDVAPLDDVLNELRHVPGNGWKTMNDPIQVWKKLRGGE